MLAACPLDPIEISVVHLARRDSLRSLAGPSVVSRLMARLFGIRAAAPLACPRLEGLRRYAVLLRHRRGIASGETERLRALGFSAAAIMEVRARVMPTPAVASRSLREVASARIALGAPKVAEVGVAWMESGPIGVAATVAMPLLRRLAA